MKTFAVNENRDIMLVDGRLQMRTDVEAYSQVSMHYMMTLKGELIHDIERGIPFFAVALKDKPDIQRFEFYIRKRLAEVTHFKSIESLSIQHVGQVLKYDAVIKTDFGEVKISDNLQLS